MQQKEEMKSAAFTQNFFDLISVFWDPPAHLCLEFNSTSFVLEKKFKRNISFSSSSAAAAGQTVSSTKQFVLNSRASVFSKCDKYEKFLLQKYEFSSDKLWSSLTPVQRNCLHNWLSYILQSWKWIVTVKAFETDWNNKR